MSAIRTPASRSPAAIARPMGRGFSREASQAWTYARVFLFGANLRWALGIPSMYRRARSQAGLSGIISATKSSSSPERMSPGMSHTPTRTMRGPTNTPSHPDQGGPVRRTWPSSVGRRWTASASRGRHWRPRRSRARVARAHSPRRRSSRGARQSHPSDDLGLIDTAAPANVLDHMLIVNAFYDQGICVRRAHPQRTSMRWSAAISRSRSEYLTASRWPDC